jgi:hypothetical protein
MMIDKIFEVDGNGQGTVCFFNFFGALPCGNAFLIFIFWVLRYLSTVFHQAKAEIK